MSNTEALVIGAGPFGLSISAHLSDLGVDHVVVGRVMNSWKTHMPIGMLMKSEPYASEIKSPHGGYGPKEYCAQHGLPYTDRVGPLTLETFLDYAGWYQEKLVPDVRDATAADITAVNGGFRVSFADADPITARQVVVATGPIPYANIPAELSGLPSDLVTHVSEHHDLSRFAGRRVAVIGAGQSALETAALLHENGVDIQVIARTPKLSWNEMNPEHVSALGHIKRPVVQLCEGWRCAFWHTPRAFRTLPESMRIVKARTVLGPAGSWWLRRRIDGGVVNVLTGHRVLEATPKGSGVRLALEGQERSEVEVDHVICGTGYRIDLARLRFLPEELRRRIDTVNGYPTVDLGGRTSVPGLYFTGAPTAVSLGPSARFVAGTFNFPRPLAKAVARYAKAGKGAAVSSDVPERTAAA
jgi:FAD-dependent urate hydroxylase